MTSKISVGVFWFFVNILYQVTASEFFLQDTVVRSEQNIENAILQTNVTLLTECIMICDRLGLQSITRSVDGTVQMVCYCTVETVENNTDPNILKDDGERDLIYRPLEKKITRNKPTVVLDEDGSTPEKAAETCVYIKYFYPESRSGFYWVKLGLTEWDPISVYCDMETDTGGWMLVTDFGITSTSDAYAEPMVNDIRSLADVTTHRFVLDTRALVSLHPYMYITQFRFYCHKITPGRTIHISTKRNKFGYAFRDAMLNTSLDWLADTDGCPPTFNIYPDDTSLFMQECATDTEGTGWDSYEAYGATEYDVTPGNRLYNKPFFKMAKHYMQIYKSEELECDDDLADGEVSSRGRWQYYVR